MSTPPRRHREPLALRVLAVLAVLVATHAGCGAPSGAATPPAPARTPSRTASVPPALTGQAIPALDEQGPVIDLFDNRFRMHAWRGGTLLVPVASLGVFAHLAEYASPWGGVSTVEGHPGRRLAARAATLRFSWPEAPPGSAPGARAERLVVRVRGTAGMRASLNLNGRNVKSVALSGGWQSVEAAIPPGLVRRGDNRLLLSASQPGLLVHSVEVATRPSAGAADAAHPPLDPVSPHSARSLDGAATLTFAVEVPAGAFLRLGTAVREGEARFRVRARPAGGAELILLDEPQAAGAPTELAVDLSSFAGSLVTLTFETEGASSAHWLAPRLLLGHAESRPRPAPVDNAILVVVDALRADRLELDTRTRVRTPRITEAATRSGAAFRRAVSPSSSSPPSHAAIQSGQAPRLHGVGGDTAKPSPLFSPVSAILSRAGIATAFHGNNPFAMERLAPASAWTEFHQPNREGHGLDCTAVVKGALAFAGKQAAAGRRFFVSTLPFEPHSPYRYHRGVTEHYFAGPFDPALGQTIEGETVDKIAFGKLEMTPARWEQMRGTYDGEVEHFDGCLGALLDGLLRIGVGDKTAIVITGDHGEGFGEHHHVGHAYGHWYEVIEVPIVVVAPGLGGGGAARLADVPVSGIDVAPTLLDLMGLPPDPRMQGQSLLPFLLRQGEWTTRVVASEYGRSYALHTPRYRLIVDYDGSELAYDRREDPTEQAPLGDKRPEVQGYLRDLAGIYRGLRSSWRGVGWGSYDNWGPAVVEPAPPSAR